MLFATASGASATSRFDVAFCASISRIALAMLKLRVTSAAGSQEAAIPD